MATDAKQRWHGIYLNEDEIFADMLGKISSDPVALQLWRDPWSWKMPIGLDGRFDPGAPEHAGYLRFIGMSIRNYYGLWHPECPFTKADGPELEITDGVITDPAHPDNVSGRIIDRLREELGTEE